MEVAEHPLELGLYRRDASLYDGRAGLVVFPRSTEEVVDCVRAARQFGVPFVPRGSGTPLDGALVICLTRMNRIVDIDPGNRCAWVEPGVINLDLSTAALPHGLHFAPDPSSQSACSIGGNVANNSGGPHCLAYGVTVAHVLGVEMVLPDGTVETFGGPAPDPTGYDLRGVIVGSEGTLGVVTKACVRLTRNPEAVRTLLAAFESVAEAAAAVSGIIARGVIPAALEMMDNEATRSVEAFVHAGYPTDAAAVLLIEVDGLPGGLDGASAVCEELCRANGARFVRAAADEAERQALWKGRKAAFGAVARVAPNYYLHDTVVPRTKLVEVLERVYEIAERYQLKMMNVFHAGDGNLHPLIAFDAREPGVLDRVHKAGAEIVEVSVAAGGVLSGEHGIGVEKRDLMPLIFSAVDLDAQARVRDAFDPDGLCNPTKVLPMGSRCGDFLKPEMPEGTWV